MFQQREIHPFQLFPTRSFGDRFNEGLERPATSPPSTRSPRVLVPMDSLWSLRGMVSIAVESHFPRCYEKQPQVTNFPTNVTGLMGIREILDGLLRENRREGEKFWWLSDVWIVNEYWSWSWNKFPNLIHFYSFSLFESVFPWVWEKRGLWIYLVLRRILWEFLYPFFVIF